MIKNIVLLFGILSILTSISSQSLSPFVVASGGGFKTSAGGSLSFTIGEAGITTLKKDSSILTQGFQQGTVKKNSAIVDLKAGDVKIELFPNPASAYLEFNIVTGELMLVRITIYDLLGNKICDIQDIQNSGVRHHAVQVTSELSNAVYVARLSVTHASGVTQYYARRFTINN